MFFLKNGRMSYIVTILIGFCIGYFVIAGYLYVFQRSILYLPNRNMGAPSAYDLYNMGSLALQTNDEVMITAWYSPPPSGERTVLVYFQGNAGHLGDRKNKLAGFIAQKFGVLALSYRGYGNSKGSPTEQGLYNDARAVIEYLAHNGTAVEDIVLYGESLGTGVAVQMATEYPIKALILEAPYTSISQRAQEIYFFLPIQMLLKDHFNSLEKISTVRAPLMILHGEEDTTIPPSHGRQLLQAATVEKEGHFFPEIGHNNFNLARIISLTTDFIKRH